MLFRSPALIGLGDRDVCRIRSSSEAGCSRPDRDGVIFCGDVTRRRRDCDPGDVHGCHPRSLSLDRVFERTTVWGDGSVPPLVVEKFRALGLTCKAHNGFTKPRSIPNVNAVPPRIVEIICRIGALRRLWIVIRIVLLVTRSPFAVFCSPGRGGGAGWEDVEQ